MKVERTGRPVVLVTGATGKVAEQILPALRERFELRLVDRNNAGDPNIEVIDLISANASEVRELFDGVHMVVHLAYKRSAPGDNYDDSVPQIDKFAVELENVKMAQNVYRASFDSGVRRVVMASSNHAANWYEHALIHAGRKAVVEPSELALADDFYGWAKASYEHLGFVYASGAFGRRLEVLLVRIGAPRDIVASTYSASEPSPSENGPSYPTGLARYKRDLGAWLSERDAQQLFVRCIDAEDISNEYGVPWQVVYGISNNTRAFWSLTSARKVLGYDPQDDSEVRYADDIRYKLTAGDVTGGRVGL